ncbi:MAG: hypothetical protein IJ685_06195 [Selenomonadaceae bacterium]|nr:hypothetical protein [Selenomonadaceae bacterium]
MKNLNVKIVGLGESGARAISLMMNSRVGQKISAGFVAIGNDENILLTTTTKTNIFLNRDAVTIQQKISEALDGANFIILVAGLGSTAANRAIPMIISHAKAHKTATAAFANLPSKLENQIRHENAARCMTEFVKADSLFTLPAEKLFLFRLNRKEVSLNDLFAVADEIFCNGVKNFLDTLIFNKKLSASDVKFGNAAFAYGEAEGNENALAAMKNAVNFKTIDPEELKVTPKIIARVTGGELFFKSSADEAKKFLKTQIPSSAKLFWFVDKDSAVGDKVQASIMFMRPPEFKSEKSNFPLLKNFFGRFQS